MLLELTNRMFNGVQVAVFDPDTGQKVTGNININDLDQNKREHYLRCYRDGDLAEVVPAKPVSEVAANAK